MGLQQVLGLGSYQTAWAWLHKLRRAMVRPGRERLEGCVEVDESYLGGVEEGVHGRETENKAIVAVAAEELGGFDCGDLPMCLRTVCTRLWNNASRPGRSFTRTGGQATTALRRKATRMRSPL